MLSRLLSTSALTLALGLVFACSSTAPNPTNDESLNTEANQKDAPTKTNDKGAKGNRTGTQPNAETCGAKKDAQACYTCCLGEDIAATKKSDDAWTACSCKQAKSVCTPECARAFCNTEEPSGEESSGSDDCGDCYQKVDRDGKCEAEAKKLCDDDPTCSAAVKCLNDSRCDALPDAQSGEGDSKEGDFEEPKD